MIITIGRKPYKTALIDNVLKNECGGINIDQTRIGDEEIIISVGAGFGGNSLYEGGKKERAQSSHLGRFPANVLFSKKTAIHLPPIQGAGHWANCKVTGYGDGIGEGSVEYYGVGEKDNSGGTVAKFFFIVKE